MCIIPDIVTENSVNVLRIENYTKISMGYGTSFSMEYFYDNKWKTIDFDFYFTAIGYALHAGKVKEEVDNLYSLVEKYNDSKKGKYRIIKDVWLYNYPNPPGYNLIAEFEVK
jgi:hypothetical protein